MPNIDDLSIGIKSNVTSATNSIDKLISRLGVLSASLGQVNTSGFQQMARGISQIEVATKNISADSANKLATLSLAIRKFGSSTANAATSNIPQLSNSIRDLANTINSIGNVNFNSDGLTNFASAINKLGGVKVTTAVTNLPQLTTALQQIAVSVNQIGQIQGSVTSLTQLATALSRMGGKTVTNAITNIPQLTNALMQMMNTLSRAPQVSRNTIDLTNAIANLASQGSKVGTATRSMSSGLNTFKSHAKGAHKSANSLASAIGKLYAKYWMLFRLFSKFGKAIGFASDIKEVQNVIDVSFGDYKNVIEEFSKTSIQNYGISELTSKKMAGRFQAMGTAVGFSQEKMAEMSTTLTGLAADMGSFYNVEAEQVAESLQSIFTGTTKPMRAYGVDLTMATLQEYAFSKGIDANVKSMSQAEKVMLRYNYVLEHTRNAQGDFQRTQGTWANQIRILKQQFVALGGVIGQNFIYALKPMIQALNAVMGKLIQFAKVVSESLGTIFGWKYEDTTGGIVNDIENGSDYADDLSGGLGSAANNAKKLKQQLQGFDRLNVLTSNNDTSHGGGGGTGNIGNLDISASGGQWVKLDNTDKFFTSELDSLYKLGEYISTTLREQLQKIDWDEVYQGAKDWGKGLANFLNGYINPEMFHETGKALAGALNTAIYAALSFADNFDFENLGDAWAQRFNGFFEELDTASLAEAISKWIRGSLTAVTTFLTNTDFQLIGQSIGDFVTNIDWSGIVIDLGKLAKAILGAIVDAFIGLSSDSNAMLEIGFALAAWFGTQAVISKISGAITTSISTAATSASAGATLAGSSLGTYLASGLVAAFIGYGVGEKIDEHLHEHGLALDDVFSGDDVNEMQKVWTKMDEYAADYSKSYQDLVNSGWYTESTLAKEGGEAAFNATRNKLLTISKKMQEDAKNMSWGEFKGSTHYQGALENLFGGDEDELKKTYEELRNTYDNLANLPTTAALAYSKAGKNFAKTTNTISKNTKIASSAYIEMQKAGVNFDKSTGKVLSSVSNNYKNANSSIENFANSISDSIGKSTSLVVQNTTEMANSNSNNLDKMARKSSTFGSSYIASMTNTFLGACDISRVQTGNMKSDVLTTLDDVNSSTNSKMSTFKSNILSGFTNTLNGINTNENKTKWYDAAWYLANSSKNGIMDRLTNSEDYGGSIKSRIGNAFYAITKNIDSEKNKTKWYDSAWYLSNSATSGAKEQLTSNKNNGGVGMISAGFNSLLEVIKGQNWYAPGVNLVEGLSSGIQSKWGLGVGSAGSLVATVGSLADNLTRALKNAFGIHSPSKIWKNEIGYYLTKGLEVGVLGEEGHLNNAIIGMGSRLTDTMSGALTLATPSKIGSNFDFGVTNTMAHTYSADTSMSNNIADGISKGMYAVQSEQNALLREQNELLYQILQKDVISSDEVYNVVVNKNIDTFNRTGYNPLMV